MKDETPSFDFGTDPVSSSAVESHSDAAVGGKPTDLNFQSENLGVLTAASVGSEVEWREVPEARFLSWSPRMRAAYMRDRDLASMEDAEERGEDPEFYRLRANAYNDQVNA